MPFSPIVIDRKSLTLMGVSFPDLATLETTAQAIGSNMFEGYKPTRCGIEVIRDYCLGKITLAQVVDTAKENQYAE